MESNNEEFQKLHLRVSELSSELEKQNAIRSVTTKWLVIVGSVILAALGFTNFIQIPKEAEIAAKEAIRDEAKIDITEEAKKIQSHANEAENILADLKKGAAGTTSDTIAFFARDSCPDGWQEFKEGSGRFLIASGEEYSFLSKGGKKEVAMSIAEMPRHTHAVTNQPMGFKARSNTWRGGGSAGGTYTGVNETIDIQNTGEGKPHDNMPPYLALTLCRKQ